MAAPPEGEPLSSEAGLRPVWWGEFRSTEFAGLDPDATIAVLPLAAVEQHGPHLPTGTDALIADGMLRTAIERLPPALDIRILPLQAVGKSNEHIRSPGTLTLPAAAAIEAWTEIGLSVHRAGIRKLVLVNSHGGNEEIMGIVARELRVRADMLAVKTSWTRFGLPEGLFTAEEARLGIHGGDVETSLMLHFRPELVDPAAAANFASIAAAMAKGNRHLGPTGPHSFAWLAADLNPHGVVGDASAATAEKGRRVAEHQASRFVELLAELRAVALAGFAGF